MTYDASQNEAGKVSQVSDSTWQAVVERTLDAIVIADASGQVIGWNPQAEATFGWTEAEALGRPVAELVVPPEMQEAHHAGWARFQRTGVPHVLGERLELTGAHRHGRVFPIELTVSVHDVGGDRVFSAAIRDISLRAAAQARADRQADGLRVLTAIAADRYQRLDPQLQRALGASLTHLGGVAVLLTRLSPHGEILHASAGDGAAVETIMAEAVWPIPLLEQGNDTATAHVRDLQTCCVAGVLVDGDRYGTVSFWARGPHDPEHAEGDHDFVKLLGGWIGAALERDAAMAAQREGEDGIRVLQETAASRDLSLAAKVRHLLGIARERSSMETGLLSRREGDGFRVLVATGSGRQLKDGDIIPGTEALTELVCSSGEELVISDLDESPLRSHPARTKHGLRSFIGIPVTVGDDVFGSLCLSSSKPRERFDPAETEYLRLLAQWAGRELENEENVAALARANRDLEGLVTSTRALADEAQAASRAKSDFLAVMSHEMRTPMNGVLGVLDLLSGTDLTSDQHAQVQLAVDSGRSLVALIDEILDFSRVEAGEVPSRPAVFSVRELTNDVVELIAAPAARRGVRTDVWIEDRVPELVLGLDLRVRQVLSNLIGNAAKFTEHGEILVTVDQVDSGDEASPIRFTVRDTAGGVPEDVRDRLFEPFIQGDASSTRRHGGTGLGLAISRRLVEHMGGLIGYQPTPEGSQFWFEVPLPTQHEPLVKTATPVDHARPSPLGRARILVVEDHPINQAVALRMLERIGHEAHLAENGEEALERLERQRFDIVLMDCRMPVLDGYAATRQFRIREAKRGARRTPVIALTANALPEEQQRCLDAGMDDHLAKPITTAALDSMLERWIGHGADDPSDAHPQIAEPHLPPVIFDAERFSEATGGEDQLGRELLRTLQDETALLVERIEVASAASDSDAVTSAAHAIKGAAATLGFIALANAARAVEENASAGGDVAGAIAELRRHIGDPGIIAAAFEVRSAR